MGGSPTPGAHDLIRMRDVSVTLGGRATLRDVSLRIRRGAVLAIVGPSGAGKTTLLRVLNGLVPPSAGSVVCAAGAISDERVRRRHCSRTSTIFQEHALIGRLSALENVLLGLSDRRPALGSLVPWPNAMKVRALRALRAVGLVDRAHSRTRHLSGGERQRIGFARALVREPMLILADEPFAALHPELAGELADRLRRAAVEEGVTVVVALHQMDLMTRMADRVIGLNEGRIVFEGSPFALDRAAREGIFGDRCAARPATVAQYC